MIKNRWKQAGEFFWTRSWIVALVSFLWLVIRTGTKPSRIYYPCQKQARNNLMVFGLPAIAFFCHRLSHSSRFRKKVTVISLLAMVLMVVSIQQLLRVVETETSKQPISAQSTASKVVWITDSRATLNRNYTMAWVNKADQTVIDTMADRAILALTNQTSVAAAWTQLFSDRNEKNGRGRIDWQSGEKIAIKINNNNAGCEEDNNHCPLTQSIVTVLRQLITIKGIPQTNITVYDVSRGLYDYQITAIQGRFPNVVIGQYNVCSGQKVTNIDAYVAADLAGATYLINMPLLRTHLMAGATLSLKNHLGSTCTPASFHEKFFNSSGNGLVYLNSNINIKNKTVLVWDDAIYGLKTNGPYGNPDGDQGIKNPYPNSFFLSVDPVAMDSVMVDYLQDLRQAEWWYPDSPRIALQAAANGGLGNYATSCTGTTCSYSYSNINLIRCNPTCPGSPTTVPITPTLTPTKTPTPIATKTPTPTVTPAVTCKTCPSNFSCYFNQSTNEYRWFVSGYVPGGFVSSTVTNCGGVGKPGFIGKSAGDANCDGYVNGTDYSIWRREYLDISLTQPVVRNNWEADFTGANGGCDGMINGYDYSLWRREYQNGD